MARAPVRHRASPHTRTVGGTFEISFTLPEPANAGGGPQKAHKTTNPTNRANRATTPLRICQDRREYIRTARAKRRAERKALGLCRDCPNQSTLNQIRCSSCAEKQRLHRVSITTPQGRVAPQEKNDRAFPKVLTGPFTASNDTATIST